LTILRVKMNMEKTQIHLGNPAGVDLPSIFGRIVEFECCCSTIE